MHKQLPKSSLWGTLILAFAATALAGDPASVQSPMRAKFGPWATSGLPLWSNTLGLVQAKKTDSAALSFYNNDMSGFLTLVNNNLKESSQLGQVENRQLAPEKLFFYCEYTPRVYFLTEGAGYTNGLGATICKAKPDTGKYPYQDTGANTFLIIPNSQSSVGGWGSNSGVRSTSEPLLPGDFVDLPTIKAGEQLELFLIANQDTYAKPESVYYNDKNINVDKLQHMVAFFPKNSRYIILGLEDIKGGGDLDYNDLVFAIDVGDCNALMWQNPNGLPK